MTVATSRVSRIVTGVLCAGLVLAAIAYRDPLGRWFSGKDTTATGSRTSKGGGVASSRAGHDHAADVSNGDAIDHYTCSMHPSVNQPRPGKCPICGMNLVPVTKAQQSAGVVVVDAARRQLIGVRTGTVIAGPMQRTFRAVGQVTYDESSFADVNLKVSGWITKLLVSQTGQRVTRGQTMFLLYSPELYNAQQDFLLATRSAGEGSTARVDQLGRAARKRLSLLGLNEEQIQKIAAGGEVIETLPIAAPASGFVIEKNVVEGASVAASMRLFRIAALDRVWVEAEVYEEDVAHVRVGQSAKVTLDHLPGQAYDAKVAYVYPYLAPDARTTRVRIELQNKALELRPGMYVSVELSSAPMSRVQVPVSAVVYTGPRRLVFIDLGEGRFKPQEVRLGAEADGMYEVLEGLRPGDSVATSGTFLLAAEARISTAAKYWNDDAPAQQQPVSTVEPPAEPPAAHHATRTKRAGVQRRAPPPIAAVYSCPMHPEVRSATAGKCPKCGMQLVLVPNETAP